MIRSFFVQHRILVSIVVLGLVTTFAFTYQELTKNPLATLLTTTTTEGISTQIVAVAGVTESQQTADLAFPTSGVVATITATEGTVVAAGTLLATLASERESAALKRAEAAVAIARSALLDLETGVRPEARAVTSATVEAARAEVLRVTAAANQAVDSARRALYSNSLTARTEDYSDRAVAPIVTGTYRCNETGQYLIKTYDSNSESGYSMTVSGLDTGTYPVSTKQPVAFGRCGLSLQFAAESRYNNSTWVIDIPNQNASNYITLRNALTAAETDRDSAIASANEALVLAERRQILENAAPVPADIIAARARVAEAEATRAELAATLADRSIFAPFTGMITRVDILPGETAGQNPVITLLSTDTFEVVTRVPEIDITKLALNQPATVRFDAEKATLVPGTVTYIAPLPTLVDGVAYFEVKVSLIEKPSWLRGGLNADVDIIVGESARSTLVPNRYVTEANGEPVVRVLSNGTIATTSVTVTFRGTDGLVAVTGIAPETTLVAP